MKVLPILTIAVGSLLAPSTQAQFALDWFTIAGGAGTSVGGAYAISGTIGQPEAAWPVDQNGFAVQSTGGTYRLIGGFWSAIQQGGPSLKIKKRAGQLVLSWPADATGVVVQSATQLTPGGADWSDFAGNPVRVGDEFELTIGPALTPPNSIRFFRLHSP